MRRRRGLEGEQRLAPALAGLALPRAATSSMLHRASCTCVNMLHSRSPPARQQRERSRSARGTLHICCCAAPGAPIEAPSAPPTAAPVATRFMQCWSRSGTAAGSGWCSGQRFSSQGRRCTAAEQRQAVAAAAAAACLRPKPLLRTCKHTHYAATLTGCLRSCCRSPCTPNAWPTPETSTGALPRSLYTSLLRMQSNEGGRQGRSRRGRGRRRLAGSTQPRGRLVVCWRRDLSNPMMQGGLGSRMGLRALCAGRAPAGGRAQRSSGSIALYETITSVRTRLQVAGSPAAAAPSALSSPGSRLQHRTCW